MLVAAVGCMRTWHAPLPPHGHGHTRWTPCIRCFAAGARVRVRTRVCVLALHARITICIGRTTAAATVRVCMLKLACVHGCVSTITNVMSSNLRYA